MTASIKCQQAICETEGAYLAEPRSFSLLQILLLLKDVTPDSTTGDTYYLGATDEQTEGDFRWLTTGEPLKLCNWNVGEPSNKGSISPENMLVLLKSTNKFNDINGSRLSKFFCQKDIMNHAYVVIVPRKVVLSEMQLVITTSYPENTFYTVSQYMASLTCCAALDELISDVSATLEPQKWISLDPRLGLNSSGIFQEHVVIRSTQPLTVVLTVSQNIRDLYHATATLILPVALLSQNYIILSPPLTTGQLAVISLYDGTDVTLKVPVSSRHDAVLDVGGATVRHTGYVTFTLDKYQTALVGTTNLNTGLLYATRPIAVFTVLERAVLQKVTFSNPVIDMQLPVEVMTSQYVTFPLWPSSDKIATYKLLAIHDNTVVEVFGSEHTTIALLKHGDIEEMNLPESGFYFMESNFPFQIRTQYLESTAGACVTSLLPSTLWRTEYSFTTPSVLKNTDMSPSANVLTAAAVLFLVSEIPAFDINHPFKGSCSAVTGSQLFGCYFQIILDKSFPVSIFNNGTKFAAYVAWVRDESQMVTCYPLGADVYSSNKTVNNKYDGLAELNFSDTSCKEVVEGDMVTSDFLTSLVTSDVRTSLDEGQMALTTQNSNISTSGRIDVSTEEMTTFSNIHNFTEKADDTAFMCQLVRELVVDYKTVSAFRRWKTSVLDDRLSAAILGVCGVTILMVFFALIVISDIREFCFLTSDRQRKLSH